MNRKKMMVAMLLAAGLFALAVLGGKWSSSYAQTTIPTDQPGPKVTQTPGLPDATCVYGTIDPKKELDLYLLLYPDTRFTERWGGVMNPVGSAAKEETEVICKVPPHLLPHREKLYFYSWGLEVRAYDKGHLDAGSAAAPMGVYFDLTSYERFLYEHLNSTFGFYMYNPANQAWETCPKVTFDEKQGTNGRLSCQSTQWGFYALGWQSGK